MFKKPLSELKTSAPLRNSERKKLRERVLKEFNVESIEDGDILVPEGLLSRKFATSSKEPGVAYLGAEGNPLWFSIGKGNDALTPSVYTLWKYPRLLPFLSTPKQVIPILRNGADLMAAGVAQMSGDPLEGQLVAITQYEDGMLGSPLAIGMMAMPGSKIRGGERTGKAVYILHVHKDKLWELGDKSEPPPPEPVSAESGAGNELIGSEDEENVSEGDGQASLPPPTEGELTPEPDLEEQAFEPLSSKEVSDTLRGALLQAIATTASKLPTSAFPLSASQFYTQHILPARPSYIPALANAPPSYYSQIDIKHSDHKSLVAFLRMADKDGLLRLKESKGKGKNSGDAQVILVDSTHPEVVAHKRYKTLGELEAKAAKREEKFAAEAAKPYEVQITELYMPHGSSIRLFELLEKDSTTLYTSQEVKEALNAYINSNSLVNEHKKQFININENLSGLFKGNAPEFLKREELTRQLLDVMQPWHRIEVEGAEPVTKKGKLQPIHITTKTRIGRKACTFITHFEPFHFSADTLAEELRRACASATTTDPLPGKNAGVQVMVQGRMASGVKAWLLKNGMPKNWIVEEDLMAKKK